MAARKRGRLMAARSDGDGAAGRPRTGQIRRARLRLWRRTLDHRGGHRRGSPSPGADDGALRAVQLAWWSRDRKSTRLNSSHMSISYAVFCFKKKKKTISIHSHTKKKIKEKNTR